jgi:hypothetical protein
LRISKSYVVPKDDEEEDYPDHIRGMNLGMICKEIRRGNAYKAHFDELFHMGFPYQSQVLAERGLTEKDQQLLLSKGLFSELTQFAASSSSSSSSSRGAQSLRGGKSACVEAEEEEQSEDSDSGSSGILPKPLSKQPGVIAVSKRNKDKTKGDQVPAASVLKRKHSEISSSTTTVGTAADKPGTGKRKRATVAAATTAVISLIHPSLREALSSASPSSGTLSSSPLPKEPAVIAVSKPGAGKRKRATVASAQSSSEPPLSHSSSSSSSSSSVFSAAASSQTAFVTSSSSSSSSKEPHNSTGWIDRVRPALLAYRQLHGQSSKPYVIIYELRVPIYFTYSCRNIRSSSSSFPGVKAFHKLIPATFVVPSDNAHFPPNTWGIKLGKIAHNIKVTCFQHI